MLLQLPSKFRSPTGNDASVEIEMACDWIEASVLFSSEKITSPTVADILIESQWFSNQPDARAFVDDVWARLRVRRLDLGGAGPFDFDYQTIFSTVKSWEKAPEHAFCLILSYARHHKKWADKQKWNYNTQGEIFEKLTEGALTQLLPTWTVHRTGWSSGKPEHLPAVVESIAKHLCGEVKNLKRWNSKNAKEQGLDILCYRRFSDGLGNFPAFFVQCASGKNFSGKLHDPDLAVWNDLVEILPASLPRKAFASPFIFPKREFQQNAIKTKGLFLDRSRLLSASLYKADWIQPEMSDKICNWARSYVGKLPWAA